MLLYLWRMTTQRPVRRRVGSRRIAPSDNSGGITKARTGNSGLDEITRGGLPRNRTTLLAGGPGSGKTIVALETLVKGAREFNEPGIFVAFEEQTRAIRENAASFGWDIPALEKAGKLFFFDAQWDASTITAGDFELTGLLTLVAAKAEEMGATRVVFDAVDVLLTVLNEPAAERRELLRLQQWLAEKQLTAIVTGKIDPEDPVLARRNSLLQFMVDAVIRLEQWLAGRVMLRTVRVLKYRGSSFAENEISAVIGARGMEIATVSSGEKLFAAPRGRISTGVERLDTMLSGGYFRGASVLITGSPGTSKSTLSCAFLEAACLRGERALYVSFDESADEIIRNSSSVGIRLAPQVKRGLLKIQARRADAASADAQLLQLQALIAEHNPTCVVVDPVSALVKGGGTVAALTVCEGLLHVTKARGITIVCTSLLDGDEPHAEASSIQISTVADTWIHVSYTIQAGERNRALTIVKSRGTRHSNQVRELVLSADGITLSDVYTAGGEVLMGTMRWLKEQSDHAEQQRARVQIEQQRREIETAQAELAARQRALEHEIALKQNELELLTSAETAQHHARARQVLALSAKRNADAPAGRNGAAKRAASRKGPE